MADVFISYSRKDIAFARLLYQALKDNQFETWIDWQDIPPSVDWLNEVYEAIEQTDVFIFIISETSVISEVCSLEIAHAEKHNKRLIPIVINEVEPSKVPQQLKALNWIFFREGDEFSKPLSDLIEAIQVDRDWVKEHTRYLNRALDWERGGKKRSALLRGSNLEEAEHWLSSAEGKSPPPTPLHRQFILASRQAANRRQRLTLGVVLGVLAVSALIGLSAWIMRNRAVHEEHVRATAEAEAVAASHMRATAQYRAEEEALIRATAVQEAQIQKEIAEEEREIAVSRQLAAEAWRESEQLDLALLLSLEASHIRDTREARSSLLKGLIQFSHLETIWHTSAEGVIKFLSTSPRSKTSVVQNGGQLMVWDGEQRTLRELKGVSMDESVEDIAVHADGSVSLIALDGLLYRWTADNPNPDTVPWGNPEGLEGLGFARLSPDGTMIAAVQGDTVTIWDAGDGSLLGEPMTKTGTMITELCFSPDGTALAVGYHNPEEMTGEAVIWDLTSREIEGPPFPLWSSEQVVLKLAFSPDGSVLYTGTDDVEDEEDDTTGNGRFWDVQSREHLTWSVFPLGDTEVVFSENGQRAAIQQGATIRLWERKGSGYYLIDEFDAPSPDGGVALTPEGERLFTGSADGKVYVWAFKETETIIQQPLQDAHNCLYFAFNPDGGTLFADCWLQGPRIWDVDSGECLDHHEQVIEYPEDTHDEEPSAAAYSPDGSRIASGYVGGDVVLWNPDSLEPARDPLQGCGGEIHELAFSPDGRWLAAVSHEFSGSVLVFWRAEDGEHMLTLGEEDRFGQGEWLRFNSLAFSPIEDRLVVAGRYVLEDSTAVHGLWFIDGIRSYLAGESESFTVEKVLDDLPIAHLAFHPDGTVLAAASGGDEKVHFFDADTMEEIGFLYHGHEYSIESLALSPQGRLMASGGGDSTIADIGETIQLWDLNTKQPIGPRLPGEGLNMVYDLAFSPDGSKLASYSGNSDLVIWDVSLESWRRYACQMANRNLTDQEWTMYLGDRPYRQTCGSDPGLAP